MVSVAGAMKYHTQAAKINFDEILYLTKGFSFLKKCLDLVLLVQVYLEKHESTNMRWIDCKFT